MTNARFSITPANAVRDQSVSHSQYRTLAALGLFGDRNGWCWPSLATLAELLNKSHQAVSRDIHALKEAGYLNIHPQFKEDGGRTSNKYQIRFDYPLQHGVEAPSTSEVEAPSTSEVAVTSHINDPKKDSSPNGDKPARKKPASIIALEELELVYSKYRPARLPDWNGSSEAQKKELQRRWRTPLRRIWKEAGEDTLLATRAVIAAINTMKAAHLTIATPQSIEMVALSFIQDNHALAQDGGERNPTLDRLRGE